MNQATKTNPIPVTLGLDIGDKKSHYCALDHAGKTVLHRAVSTRPRALETVFTRLRKQGLQRVALEAGSHSPWVSELLAGLGLEVFVANPYKVALISRNDRKSDRVDAELLARLARVDPELLRPIQHRGPRARADLAMLRSRAALVAARTQLINHVRGSTKPWGLRLPGSSTASFHKKMAPLLPEQLTETLSPVLAQIEHLTYQIRLYDRRIEELSNKHYPETALLRQVKGVGPVTALAYVLTIESPERILKARNVGAYLGLVPRRHESGSISPQLKITKAGDAGLRSLLVSCAQYILGPFGEDCDLRRYGERIALRGGKAAKKRAVTAVARKLSVLLLRLWQTGEAYDPLRNSNAQAARAGA